MKTAKKKYCQNPDCYSHEYGFYFTLSTAIDEKRFCSLECESGIKPPKRKK